MAQWLRLCAPNAGDPAEERIRKMLCKLFYMYTIEYYSAIKKNEIMPFAATGVDLESVLLSEVSQTERNIV